MQGLYLSSLQSPRTSEERKPCCLKLSIYSFLPYFHPIQEITHLPLLPTFTNLLHHGNPGTTSLSLPALFCSRSKNVPHFCQLSLVTAFHFPSLTSFVEVVTDMSLSPFCPIPNLSATEVHCFSPLFKRVGHFALYLKACKKPGSPFDSIKSGSLIGL